MATDPGKAADGTAGPVERWLAVRAVLREHRHELSAAAARLYPGHPWAGHPGLLGAAGWLPAAPVPLHDVTLAWDPAPAPPVTSGTGPGSGHVRPPEPGGGRYRTYAGAIAALDPPALFDNRVCYRLLDARLAGAPRLRLGQTWYFDAVNVGHAVAHELAAAWQESPGAVTMARLPLRAAAGDPCALPRRPAIVAVAALTLRRGRGGDASFVLHWRDPAKVNHAGGMYQVMPVGLFQPVTATPAGIASDLSLWRCLAREFSEEFLGSPEEYQAPGGVVDYHRWPFYQRLAQARRAGKLTVHCLGLGVDPLTFATDLLTVATFDSDLYDDLFGSLVTHNAEGRVITAQRPAGTPAAPAAGTPAGAGAAGIPFTARTVARLTTGAEPVQASGAALLALAWQHRRHLLAR